MQSPTQKLDKGLEYDLYRAELNRRRRDPIEVANEILLDAGENPNDFTNREKLGMIQKGLAWNVEL